RRQQTTPGSVPEAASATAGRLLERQEHGRGKEHSSSRPGAANRCPPDEPDVLSFEPSSRQRARQQGRTTYGWFRSRQNRRPMRSAERGARSPAGDSRGKSGTAPASHPRRPNLQGREIEYGREDRGLRGRGTTGPIRQ